MKKINSNLLREIYKKRESSARKYDHGLVIVIGGSKVYSGSPALSAFSAFRAGADMVQIIAPQRAADIAAGFSPSLVAFPLEGGHLSTDHLSDLLALTRSAKTVARGNVAVVIGGGTGRDEETKKVIREYLKEVTVPVVIDADAIYALEDEKIDFTNKNFLITPHLHEFYVLTGIDVGKTKKEDRGEVVKLKAKELSSVILLKGELDFISDGEEIAVNEISVPYLTTGGCGDTLAGISAALLARGVEGFKAAQVAAFINAKAGKLAADEKGESLIAVDLINKIEKIIK